MTWRNLNRNRDTYLRLFTPGKTLIVFDTETTGLGPTAKIIQFSGIRYLVTESGMRETGMLDLYINPEEPLEAKITELTGITDGVLKNARNETVEAPGIFAFLNSADFWSAYNAKFDLRMLRQMSERTGLTFTEHESVDALSMARDIIPKEDIENYKLCSVVEYLFPDAEFQFHAALDDVKATAMCLAKFVGKYLTYRKEPDRIQTKLEWASYWENPRCPSQKRIKLSLPIGDYGDIFWDIISKSWSHKATGSAKKLFARLDLENLENQVVNRYGWRYGADNMEDLAYLWSKKNVS